MRPTDLPLAPCTAAVDARLYQERYADLARDVRRACGNLYGSHTQPHHDELATLAEAYAALADRYEALADTLSAAERAD